ncbi:hypothetical protein P5664_12995 [Bacillus subtilis]|nr:hypothetical protein P5659_16970 [Bacillus subtilis]WGD82960.1 hypothetical protein P5664_12995 [Bacillus subtilis]WGD95865.1 hypothetical protein P5642_06320 [Bacillus subtilis]
MSNTGIKQTFFIYIILITQELNFFVSKILTQIQTEFLNSDYSEEDKNEFIEEAADGIYFPEDDITPLEWLKQVTEQIRKHLKTT